MSRNSLKNVAKLIDIANNEVSIEKQFLTDLKNSIEKANNEPYKPSQTIKPSSFNCVRNAYYQLIGVEPEQSKATYNLAGICESGSNRHLDMQRNIIKMKDILGIDIDYIDIEEFVKSRNLTDLEIREKQEIETKLYNRKYNMSFMTDGIIKYKSKYFIFEFKTETADKFYKRQGVDESHINQAIAYSLNFRLDNVIFLYENRNTMDLKCYLFNVTDEMRKDMIDKIEKTLKFAKEKQVPPKPIDVTKKTCSYCVYKNQCRKGYINNMKNKIEIILNYDFDSELGYTQKSIQLDSNEWCLYENQLTKERKVMVNLYEEDIKELLKGTGISIDAELIEEKNLKID